MRYLVTDIEWGRCVASTPPEMAWVDADDIEKVIPILEEREKGSINACAIQPQSRQTRRAS